MTTGTAPPPLISGLDLDFIHRVYRTTLVLVVLGVLAFWELGAPRVLGWLTGAGLSLLVIAGVEWSVRRYIRPDAPSAGRLVAFMMAKMALIGLLLMALFLAALRGWVSLVWVVAGFSLPYLVIVLKLLGRRVMGRV